MNNCHWKDTSWNLIYHVLLPVINQTELNGALKSVWYALDTPNCQSKEPINARWSIIWKWNGREWAKIWLRVEIWFFAIFQHVRKNLEMLATWFTQSKRLTKVQYFYQKVFGCTKKLEFPTSFHSCPNSASEESEWFSSADSEIPQISLQLSSGNTK